MTSSMARTGEWSGSKLPHSRTAAAAALLLGGIVLWGGDIFAQGQRAVPVSTIKVAPHRLEQTLELKGSVHAFAEVKVFSKVSGVIEQLLVDVGALVNAGDTIATVEHRSESAQREQLAATVQVAEASLAQAQAQFENAELEKERAEGLLKDESIPKQRFDAALAQYRIARAGRELAAANVLAATKALKQMDVRIADFTIRAPIAGVVSARFIDQGAMDSPQLPIVTITNMDTLKILSQVPETDIGKIRKGTKATVRVDAYPDDRFQGEVTIVNPTVDPRSRTSG